MTDIAIQRRFFAEEIEAVAKLSSPRLVDAFATVSREAFLRPGPWTVIADVDYAGGAAGNVPANVRPTPDADPRRVYHNIAIAIDPERRLFNGQPGTVAVWIDALALAPGSRVLHVGCGLGYYTAVIAHTVGPTGLVVAYEVDETLAAEAARNLASMPWVRVRGGNAAEPEGGPFDAILVNAGVTHPLDAWLDALAPNGRMILPLTSTMSAIGATIGKGLVFRVTKCDAIAFDVRIVGFVAIYSALDVRSDEINARLGKAMMGGPAQWGAIKRLRRDAHDPSSSCWLHATGFCLSFD